MKIEKSLVILPDFREEGWPSMDLVADKLLEFLPKHHEGNWHVEMRCPRFVRGFSRIPIRRVNHLGFNGDRILNRYVLYPQFVARLKKDFDFYYVADHSYAHLVHSLPANQTGVYCHDLDAFRCLTQPEVEPRPWWFKGMSRRILSGLRSAAVIFYSTKAVHADILRFNLVDPTKLVHAPYGVDNAFSTAPLDSPTPPELIRLSDAPWLLHVGATIPRKRIDILLKVFAAARERCSDLRLCKIGSAWTAEQESQIKRDDLGRSIVHLGKVSQSLLIEAYRHTNAVMVTSDAEGFGLPLIEAMACGAPVIASDIPVLREIGGSGAIYAKVGDLKAWGQAIHSVLSDDGRLPTQESRLAWASQFTWSEHTRIVADAFLNLK